MTTVESFLVRHGFDELAASIWAKFLHAVFDALRDAEAMVRSPGYWNEYRQKDGAFLKPGRGGRSIRRLPAEEGLTHALYECLWKVKARSDLDHPLRDLAIEFHSEAKLPSQRRTGKKARRTDIWARSCKNEYAPDIVFEAKLIADPYDLQRRYLGSDGLGCFLGPKEPYSRNPIGGLCGYTVDGTRLQWLTQVEEAMSRPPPIASSQHWISIGSLNEAVLCSCVGRPLLGILEPIAIVHVIMHFDAEPNPSSP